MRRLLPGILYCLSMLLIAVDVFGSGDRVQHLLGIDSRIIALSVVYISIILRMFKENEILKQVQDDKGRFLYPLISKLNAYIIFPLTLITSVILTVWAFMSPPNTVYALIPLHYPQLFIIALVSGIITLLHQPDAWFKKYASLLIFFSGITVFAVAEVVWMFPFETFRILSHEDGYIEYLQVFSLLLASLWSIRNARRFFRKKLLTQAAAFALTALLLFFVAGEEVSWGQRIFHIQTPESISENNLQGEITLHNLKTVQGSVDPAYIFLGLWGTCAWIFQRFIRPLQKAPIMYVIPPWFTSFYFFLGFVYFIWARFFPNLLIGHWSEFAELMLYTGVMFTLFSLKQRN